MRTEYRRLALVTAFCILVPVAGSTETAVAVTVETPQLEVTVPRQPIWVGDLLVVRVLARGGADWSWGDLEIVEPESSAWAVAEPPRPVAGTQPPAWEIVLMPLDTGEQQLPSLRTAAQPPGGEPRTVVPRQPIVVPVASVLPAGEQLEPAPLRGPVGVRGLAWEWLLPGTLLLAPMLALTGLWLRHRRTAAGAARMLAPSERLQSLIAALRSSLDEMPAESVCDQLSTGLRRFLEDRTAEPALEMTSAELLLVARRGGWPPQARAALQQVLALADGVRFARRAADREQLHAATTSALLIGREIEAFCTRLALQQTAGEEPS